jgi:hypothetical protein
MTVYTSGITNISRDWGNIPCIVRITSLDSLAMITTPGYLLTQASQINAINMGYFQWQTGDIALISYAGGEGFFKVDFLVNFDFTPLSSTAGSFTITNAELLTMGVTPLLMIPAAGPHTWIVLNTPIAVEYDYSGAVTAGGGAFGLQYGNTTLLGGTAASTTEAAATINGFGADNGFTLNAAATGTMASMVNTGIYVGNATGNFTNAGGAATITVNYTYNVYSTTA